MVKKPTLIVLLCALVLGAAAYYFDWRRGEKEKPSEDTSKPAFSFQEPDVVGLVLTRPAKATEPAIRLEKRNDVWQIVQPIETDADQPSVEGIIQGLSSARITQTEPGTPDRLKVYGLDPPQVFIEFQLKNGTKHTVLMGNKDFTEISAYSIVDGAKNVSLLPESLLVRSDKSLDDLRDRTVLHISSAHIVAFRLKNPSGDMAARKEKSEWRFTKPRNALADEQAVDSLLGRFGDSKLTAIVSERPNNPGKYGLASPSVTFTALDDAGKRSTLLVGKKEGSEYFARDLARPVIFRVNEDFYKKVAEGFSDLRDKKVLHFDSDDINHVEIHNANGTIAATRRSGEDWTTDSPAEVKGKSAQVWRLFSPISQARAEEVIDWPAADLLAKLVKPAIEVVLTRKNGDKLSLKISKESGEFVYARASGSPGFFKLKKQILDDLGFKPSDFAL